MGRRHTWAMRERQAERKAARATKAFVAAPTKPTARGFAVQAHQCATCIYRKDSPLNLKQLEAEIADPRMPGHFAGFRICHHATEACCRGFWDRHKNDFGAGQLAQRLGLVRFVDEEEL